MSRRTSLPGVAPFEPDPASPYGAEDEYTKPITVGDLFPLVLQTQVGEFSDEPTKRSPPPRPTRQHDPTLCDCLVLESEGAGGQMVAMAWVDVDREPANSDAEPQAAFDFDASPLGFTIIGPTLPPRRPARKP